MRLVQAMAIVMVLGLLSGCMGGTRTTTTKSIDPATGNEVVKMVEEDADFWESGNLRMYYEADGKRTDNHRAVADKKIDAITMNGARRTYSTPTEATLGSIIDSLLIAQIRDTAPPPTSAAPRTAVDMFERNLVPLVSMGIGIAGELMDWDIGGPWGMNSGEGSTSLEDVVAGGDLYINSERSDQYYLEEGSAWGGQENPSFNWHYETNTGNSTNSGEGQASSSLPEDTNTSLF
jgi:hypothetical protein